MKNNDLLQKLTDEELVEKIVVHKNTILFEEIYDRYAQKIYNKCFGFVKSKEEAKDLTQDVFLKLFTKLSSYKKQAKFSTWLYSFTYNLCVNFVNRNKENKINKYSDVLKDHDIHLHIEVNEDSLFQMRVDKLQKAIELIDPNEKSILLLKYQDDVSIKELQILLNINESAVKMRLKRAKSRIIEIYNSIS
ncbi:RNA polymerase sigma factor [Aquimarina muelleri]|uniref:DNA-directed RNA polymerase sigma-70 factor n=1 Tax=Aquimarina muelleri TaxID=279356 RepID=A0A918JXU7_9FLAO|nr:RNA polymerase sigma factor [Aquimarina muelleri]MCX2763677.1 RNA polymerase sigma factor [Aquimarina muelleri]GGX30269.1 DNA-directed RNA polymerase sigma-70 factor [Aquimarina muelleri]